MSLQIFLMVAQYSINHPPFFFKIYLFTRETERQREKQAPCREPDRGLDPGSPGSGPGLKAALNPGFHFQPLQVEGSQPATEARVL